MSSKMCAAGRKHLGVYDLAVNYVDCSKKQFVALICEQKKKEPITQLQMSDMSDVQVFPLLNYPGAYRLLYDPGVALCEDTAIRFENKCTICSHK